MIISKEQILLYEYFQTFHPGLLKDCVLVFVYLVAWVPSSTMTEGFFLVRLLLLGF